MDNDLDALILGVAKDRWQKVAMVIAKTRDLAAPDIDLDEIARRIRALVAAKRLEGVGDLSNWRFSEVRLVQP